MAGAPVAVGDSTPSGMTAPGTPVSGLQRRQLAWLCREQSAAVVLPSTRALGSCLAALGAWDTRRRLHLLQTPDHAAHRAAQLLPCHCVAAMRCHWSNVCASSKQSRPTALEKDLSAPTQPHGGCAGSPKLNLNLNGCRLPGDCCLADGFSDLGAGARAAGRRRRRRRLRCGAICRRCRRRSVTAGLGLGSVGAARRERCRLPRERCRLPRGAICTS